MGVPGKATQRNKIMQSREVPVGVVVAGCDQHRGTGKLLGSF